MEAKSMGDMLLFKYLGSTFFRQNKKLELLGNKSFLYDNSGEAKETSAPKET